MICTTCRHRKWVMLKHGNAHWTILGCTMKKLRFGQESDLQSRKEDKARNIVPMPEKCKDYKDWRTE